jgi:hypothetical protein
MASNSKYNAATTYTLTEFINMGSSDEQTYHNFSITRNTLDAQFVDIDIIDYYLDELKSLCVEVNTITEEEKATYKYAPDLLAYHLYGSTQLDFIIMLCNGIIDPKEFDFKTNVLLLPRPDTLTEFLSEVYNSESAWIATRDN